MSRNRVFYYINNVKNRFLAAWLCVSLIGNTCGSAVLSSYADVQDAPAFEASADAQVQQYEAPAADAAAEQEESLNEGQETAQVGEGQPAAEEVSESPFSDVEPNHAYYKAILWGSQEGVTKGYTTGPDAGTFGIDDACTRGQIVTFLYRIR